jgi:hypothetical protein
MNIVALLPTGNKLYGGPFKGQKVTSLALMDNGRVIGSAGRKTVNMSVSDFLALTVR